MSHNKLLDSLFRSHSGFLSHEAAEFVSHKPTRVGLIVLQAKIKMFRISGKKIPQNTEKYILKPLKNIILEYFKLGSYRDAMKALETELKKDLNKQSIININATC